MIRTMLCLALLLAAPALAQDAPPAMSAEEKAMMDAMVAAGTPGEAHAALAKMAGTYDVTIRNWPKPGAEPMQDTGTATRAMALGGRVLVESFDATMMGQPFQGHGMHGYDNVSGKHWSTWNDTMTTVLMVAEGTCDDAGACTFTGSWNDPMTKAKTTARMTSRWTDADTEVFEMFGPGPDGKETKMMEITYRRRAP